MKRILFLGAAHFQLPPIVYARSNGYYVVTCDNRPENPGHRLAHEAHNISTLDQAGVLELACSRSINGVISFGSDVSALTAAVVAQALGLPGAPVMTVETLTVKSRFRQFLNVSGLQPQCYGVFQGDDLEAVTGFITKLGGPAVVKPVDSSGSKGVSVVHRTSEIGAALAYAYSQSRLGEVIVERFVTRLGKQVCGDGYMEDSKLIFIGFGDGHFHDDAGLLAPFAETFPSTHSKTELDRLAQRIEAVLAAAGYCRGPFNLDAIITPAGEPFIIEIGPRCGGNFIANAIRLQTGVDLISAAVESCVDPGFVLDYNQVPSRRLFASYMLHSLSGGTFRGVHFNPQFCAHVVEKTLYLKQGATVPPFRTATDVIGNLILSFSSEQEMSLLVDNMDDYCWPVVE